MNLDFGEVLNANSKDFRKAIEYYVDKNNKYSKDYPRKCVVPKYVGTACYKGNGWIMLESEEEMDKILKQFPDAESIEFNLFQNHCNPCAIGCDEDIVGDLPKYFKSKLVVPTIKAANTARTGKRYFFIELSKNTLCQTTYNHKDRNIITRNQVKPTKIKRIYKH